VIDDCGQYRIGAIAINGAVAIGLALDDANPANAGPDGFTTTTGTVLFVGANANKAVSNFDHFVARGDTTTKWAVSGGPTLQTGMVALVFRAGSRGTAGQAGVLVQRAAAGIPDDDFYFEQDEETAETIDPQATVTGENGLALAITADAPAMQVAKLYSGTGGLPAGCGYTTAQPALVSPGIVFFSVFRPGALSGQVCNL
jgi:hypothetical protein